MGTRVEDLRVSESLSQDAGLRYNGDMGPARDEQMRRWVEGWQAAAPVLERLRAEAIRRSDTAAAIEELSDAFESARRHCPPAKTSGLVEQQRLFARLRP